MSGLPDHDGSQHANMEPRTMDTNIAGMPVRFVAGAESVVFMDARRFGELLIAYGGNYEAAARMLALERKAFVLKPEKPEAR